jgi:hypothetical protein
MPLGQIKLLSESGGSELCAKAALTVKILNFSRGSLKISGRESFSKLVLCNNIIKLGAEVSTEAAKGTEVCL